jgi:2-oxoglutarate dehydrogenase E1 component
MACEATLRDAFRRWGFLQAELDPLGRLEPLVHGSLAGASGPEAERLRRIYCGTLAVEFMHIHLVERCEWIAREMESGPEPPDRARILRRLALAEVFERFLHQRYVGTRRYSLEGHAALIPLLDATLDRAAAAGTRLCLIGMTHRGRLNVMVHIVGCPAAQLFAHFEDPDPRSVLGGGDVRYHLGATGRYTTASGGEVEVHLVSNPSHLEAVDPVTMGRARARQERVGEDGPRQVLPVLIHGDAAFAGQGIAAEALNMDGLDGFGVGGTVHIVVNNLIGFTTPPRALHASRYASDVAKRLAIPILHVNGEDPEAVCRAGRLALGYRAAFGTDVVVDLVGFRRYGHSEVDDPTTTQPLLYRRIAERPQLWRAYGAAIGRTADELDRLEREIADRLAAARDAAAGQRELPVLRRLPEYWEPYRGGRHDPSEEVDTGVAPERLLAIGERLTQVPRGFTLHPKVRKGLHERLEMARGARPVDWGMAEALAFGSLLWEGTRVRIAGQDSRRGTFNQRHAVLVDYETGEEYVPLNHLRPGQAPCGVYDTTLSEAAALGFEYGFSRDFPDALVLWEAQFGDFANGAQVILDQFLCSGEDKWNLLSGLVLLLPHGYEGQGPEHSSARLERFLQLAAEDNIQVCQPSSAAQYFHLLRRQALRRWRKPLIVMTPKSLLRAREASSALEALGRGRFSAVLPDDEVQDAGRVLVCSGKIVHELRAERSRRQARGTAILRLEQLYPFPERELEQALASHHGATGVVWVQEEPANMGALSYVRPRLEALAGSRHVTTVKRSESASPATGSLRAHRLEQRALLQLAFQ